MWFFGSLLRGRILPRLGYLIIVTLPVFGAFVVSAVPMRAQIHERARFDRARDYGAAQFEAVFVVYEIVDRVAVLRYAPFIGERVSIMNNAEIEPPNSASENVLESFGINSKFGQRGNIVTRSQNRMVDLDHVFWMVENFVGIDWRGGSGKLPVLRQPNCTKGVDGDPFDRLSWRVAAVPDDWREPIARDLAGIVPNRFLFKATYDDERTLNSGERFTRRIYAAFAEHQQAGGEERIDGYQPGRRFVPKQGLVAIGVILLAIGAYFFCKGLDGVNNRAIFALFAGWGIAACGALAFLWPWIGRSVTIAGHTLSLSSLGLTPALCFFESDRYAAASHRRALPEGSFFT